MADVCSLLTPAEMSEKLKGVIAEERLVELAHSQLIPHYTIDNEIWFGPQETKEWVNHNLIVRHQGKRLDAMSVTVVNVTGTAIGLKSLPIQLRGMAGALIPMAIESVESAKMSGVYFLCKDGNVVYVGQSVNVAQRVGQHVGAKTFDSVFFIRVASSDLDYVEGELIRLLCPKYNFSVNGCLVAPSDAHVPKDDASWHLVAAAKEATDGI